MVVYLSKLTFGYMIKYPENNSLEEKGFILAIAAKWIESVIAGKTWSWAQEDDLSTLYPYSKNKRENRK